MNIMNDQNTRDMLQIYASSHADRKKQDLIKFAETADTPHRSTAPMKRRLIAIGLCIALIAAFCGIIALSRQPHNPMSDISFIEFNRFYSGKFGSAITDTQTMGECFAAHNPMPNTLPKISCSSIVAYRLYNKSDMSKIVGIYGNLAPANSKITAVYAAYLHASSDTADIFINGAGFRDLTNSTEWNDLVITYSDAISAKDGNMFKLFFKSGEFLCCLDVYAPENMEITELLNTLF